jgi:L-lactate dehydrogenase complex protein LldG
MVGVSREQFFGPIREALRERGKRVDLPDDLEIARVVRSSEDTIGLFIKRVDESGMHAHRVADEADLVGKVAELLKQMEAASAFVPEESFPGRASILGRLEQMNISMLDVNDRDAAFQADVGITGCITAVAETGSVCVASGDDHRPLASLAPPRHIAIIRAGQIVPDLIDATGSLGADMPANYVLISGPSKTADIEMILVQGVHGPGNVHIIVVG